MNKNLTELIKESNLVIIYGKGSSGKTTLLNWLSSFLKIEGKIFTGNFSITDLENTKGNIFIEDLDICPYFLPSPKPQENEKVIKEWDVFLNSAFQKGQKTFITISNLNNLSEETRELADLFIQTKGFIPVNPNKNKLSIEVNNGILKKNSKITLNKQTSEFYNKN